MFKKLVLVGGGVALGSALLFGSSAFSYLKTSAGYVSDAVKETVPIEFQVNRARGMIQDLVPEVRKNMHVIAKEEVEVQRLDEQIAGSEKQLAKEKEQLLKLTADADSGKASFKYGERTYTLAEVKTDLANRFDRYQTNEATLGSLKEIRTAREKSLTAARQKLEGMLASKRKLQVDVENLEARLQTIAAQKATSNYQFDDSRLGQVKELVAGLRTRLEVDEKLVNAEANYQDEIPVDKVAPENIVQQVTEHFNPKAPVAVPVSAPAADAVAKK